MLYFCIDLQFNFSWNTIVIYGLVFQIFSSIHQGNIRNKYVWLIVLCSMLLSMEKFDTVQKMKFSIKDLFSKYDQICSFLWIWSYLLKKSLMENFIFCAAWTSLVCSLLLDLLSLRPSQSLCHLDILVGMNMQSPCYSDFYAVVSFHFNKYYQFLQN